MKFKGYSQDQRFRVAWHGGASESMTIDEARAWVWDREGDGVDYWIEEWNGWEWERIGSAAT